LVGPVLVKQELSEAKQTVEKRLEYIKKEMWAVCDIISLVPRLTSIHHFLLP
jgi:hypothetical protein